MVEKPIVTAEQAVDLIKEGNVVMLGGFLGCGSPDGLLKALEAKGTGKLTLVCNDCGVHNLKSGEQTAISAARHQEAVQQGYCHAHRP
ncbi:hypothetical protein MASR2M48_10560 [Spirochaetota bacterium]